jgi:protein-S-isoprenylcysteine O-methyltransferase Ste14
MRREILVDVAERVFITLLADRMVRLFIQPAVSHPHMWLLLAIELLVVGLILFRPLGQPMSMKPRDWALGFLGVTLPLLVTPYGTQPEMASVASVIMVAGMLLTIAGLLALNRRLGIVAANRGVQTAGPYALVRHPIYAGYTLTHVGFLTVNPTAWNAFVYGAGFAAQVARILVEEQLLREDSDYRRYSARVRYRLLPGVF